MYLFRLAVAATRAVHSARQGNQPYNDYAGQKRHRNDHDEKRKGSFFSDACASCTLLVKFSRVGANVGGSQGLLKIFNLFVQGSVGLLQRSYKREHIVQGRCPDARRLQRTAPC